jgi:hypothetical protein
VAGSSSTAARADSSISAETTTTTGHISVSIEGAGAANGQERVGELVDMLAKTVDRMEELLGLMRERGLDTEPLARRLPRRGSGSGSGRKGRRG